MAAPRKPAAAVEGVDFGSQDSSLYVGGFTLPAGDWAIWFDLILQQPRENSTFQKSRLGVKLSCYPLDKPGAEPTEQFLSMGGKAHESFMPNDTGKGLVPVVGGPGSLTNKSNWNLFRDSLYNAGLPAGIFSNDLSVLDGIWVTTDQQPEPEERKSFGGAATGEVDNNKAPGKIPVVVAIIEGGSPWEGGGGLPEAKAAPKAPARPVVGAPKPGPKAVTRPAPAASPAGDVDDADAVQAAAINAIGVILGDTKYASGCPKLILKTGVFKHVETTDGKPMAQAVVSAFFANDEATAGLLEQIGYSLVGTTVKASA